MRKIYSLVLMTAMLLVGTNVCATLHDTKSASDEVQITTITYDLSDPSNPVESTRTTQYGTLDEAVATTINDEPTDSVQIKLLKTVTRSESVGFFGGRVELNLDTFRILMPVSAPANGRNTVQLFKGILHIKANKVDGHQGSIICDKSSGGGVWDGAAIQVHGANDDEANYAILKVDANVRVLGQTRGVYLYVVENNTNGNAIIANNPSYITDNTSVTIQRTTNSANGAVIEVMTGAYVYGKKYGLQVTGSINNKESTNLPRVHVAHGAEIEGGKDVKNVGIYASGYAIYTIEGTVTGATGVYAKGGQVTIDGATISSNADSYSEVVYHDGKNTSGTEAAGSAVIIEGSAGSAYTGGSLVVTGETTLESTYGYAVEGLNFEPEGDTKIEGITISSGTINGGNEGVLNLSVDVAEDVKQEGTITGGTYNGDVTNYLGDNTGIITQTTDAEGNTIWAVTEGDPDDFVNSLIGASEDDLVKQSADVELNADVEVQYLAVQSNAVITIPDTYTLTAGEIVMSPTSKIIVEAGGSLVINGAQGIIANQATNIEIQTSETKSGKLLMHPSVSSNRRPYATVQFNSRAYRDNVKLAQWQRFVLPVSSMKVEDITNNWTEAEYGKSGSQASFVTPIYEWNTQWDRIDNIANYEMHAFKGYDMTNNSATPGVTYTFVGATLGNTDNELSLTGNGWYFFGNSYTAPANTVTLLQGINDDKISKTVYLWDDNQHVYYQISLDDIGSVFADQIPNEIPAMHTFIFNQIQAGSVTNELNYAELVWNSYANPAPARISASDNGINTMRISVTDINGQYDYVNVREADSYTDEFDNGSDANKFMNAGHINLYAETEIGSLASVASNNISGMLLSLQTTEETDYMISFSCVSDENYALRDNITGSMVAISNGNTYCFSAEANQTIEGRFEIVGRQEMPTAVETVDATSVEEAGIYTITGQYVGTTEKWFSLPAGIYIVNGQKVVK